MALSTKYAYIIFIWTLLINRFLTIVPPFLHMLIDAICIIWIGSVYSLQTPQKPKNYSIFYQTNFYAFPLISTIMLIFTYFLYQNFNPAYVNKGFMLYFYGLAIFSIKNLLDKIGKLGKFDNFSKILISGLLNFGYFIWLNQEWTLNNFIGFSYCIYAIQFVKFNDMKNLIISLMFFVIYDIIFVFGSHIMLFIAQNVNFPIKLIYPNLLKSQNSKFSFLGLADIMLPGIFIAFCLRLDIKLKNTNYFLRAIFGYIIGYFISIFIGIYFKKALPALIFLIPGTILEVLYAAYKKNQLKILFSYDDF